MYPLSSEQRKRVVKLCEKKGDREVLFYPGRIVIENYKNDTTYAIRNQNDIELIFGVNGRKKILGF